MTWKLVILFLFLNINIQIYGNQLYFTPDHPLCPGEMVRMVCLVIVPSSSPFNGVFDAAQISFNGSDSTFPTTLDLLPEVDTSRYTGGTEGLNITIDRPGAFLDISYLPIDSTITFGCHAFLDNVKPTEALVTGKMMGPAILPGTPDPSISLSSLEADTCSHAVVEWDSVESGREVDYHLYRNGFYISQLDSTSTRYIDTTQLLLSTAYQYSVVAANCAGNSSRGFSRVINIGAYAIVNDSVQLKYEDEEEILGINWALSNTVESAPSLTLTYSLQINSTYTQSNGFEILEENSVIFSQISTKTYLEMKLSAPILESVQNNAVSKIEANIRIIGQCGQFEGPQYFTTTTATTITPSSSNNINGITTSKPTVKGSNSGNSASSSATLLFTLLVTLVVILTILY